MTYRDICFCHASNDHYCKENNVSKCTNTECMRHASTIPDDLPEWEQMWKLLDALKTIQDECAKHKVCTDCPFFVQSEDINCGILSRNPVNWKLNKVHVIRLINQ